MKKYIPIDFDEKGKVILGNAKNTPTSNGFIPTTWAPGGSDAGNGIEWVSISPAFDTAPELDDICPIYWSGETQNINVDAFGMQNVNYTITVCPTEDAYVYADVGEEGLIGEKGEPITFSMKGAALQTMGLPLCVLDDPTDFETYKIVATLKFTPNE